MKKALLLSLFVIFFFFGFSKGNGGFYYIEGIAYAPHGVPLKNVELTVTGGESKSITTDANGRFKIKVNWRTFCPSEMSRWKRFRARRGPNVKYIIISYNGKEVKVKNKWRKYRGLTYQKDILFL